MLSLKASRLGRAKGLGMWGPPPTKPPESLGREWERTPSPCAERPVELGCLLSPNFLICEMGTAAPTCEF